MRFFDDEQRLAHMLYLSRTKAGKSQEFMAHSLGVSKMSIINWEKGVSCPRFLQVLEWFRELGVNIYRPLMELIYPEKYTGAGEEVDNETVSSAVLHFVESMPAQCKRQLAFVFFGEHDSDPFSAMNFFVAYLMLPQQNKVLVARLVQEGFEMNEGRGAQDNRSVILTDKDRMKQAVERAKQEVIQKV